MLSPCQVGECSSAAAWRTNRLGHFQLMERMLASGRPVSPVFTIPWLRSSCFKIDWLHCVDLGVAADFCGHALLLVVSKCPGSTVAARYGHLWARLQQWYRLHKVTGQLHNLKASMLQQPHASQAAGIRSPVQGTRPLGEGDV